MLITIHPRPFAMKTNGFTLIELMIVVAIIGIIAVIVLPNYSGYIERGKRVECTNYALSLASMEERFFTENTSYTSEISLASGLNMGRTTSERGYCSATITTTPESCDATDPTRRCTGFTISVSREFNGEPSTYQARCKTFTLTHNKIKDSLGDCSSDEEKEEDCWR